MKIIKNKIIYFITLIIIGATLFGAMLISHNENAYLAGVMLGTLVFLSILKILQYVKIMKNEELLKKYEMLSNEERLNSLAAAAGRTALRLSILVEYAIFLVCMVVGDDQIMLTIAGLMGIQTFIYIVAFYIYNKKM